MIRRLATALLAIAALAGAHAATPALVVDTAQTLIEVDVRATGHTFIARATEQRIEITGDVEAGRIDGARISIRWDRLATGNADRDEAMREWADAANHPEIEFTLGSMTQGTDGPVATGTLTMHGTAREISFPIAIEGSGADGLRVSGRATLDHREWNLPKVRRILFLAVNPVVTVRFTLATGGT